MPGDRGACSLARAQQIASLGHWELDLKTQVIRWSQEAARTFGIEPRQTETGTGTFWQAVHRDDQDRVRAAIEAVVASRQPADLEFRIVTPSGEECTIRQRAELALDEIGRPRLVVATVQDVTERIRLETQLRQAQASAPLSAMARS